VHRGTHQEPLRAYERLAPSSIARSGGSGRPAERARRPPAETATTSARVCPLRREIPSAEPATPQESEGEKGLSG
jgi:hypothetical protein